MRISYLRLYRFRNYENQEIEPHPFFNFFWGANGQGKTNVLEAIYFLSKKQSFRVAKNQIFEALPLKNFGKVSEKISLKLKLEKDQKKEEIFCKIFNKRACFFLNEKSATKTEIFKKLPVVLFSPESLSVIKEGPSERRDLIDQLVFFLYPEKWKVYQDFQKTLKSRNRVLKDCKENRIPKATAKDVLGSLDPGFLKLSTQFSLLRIKTLKEFYPHFNQVFQNFFKSSEKALGLEYFISSQRATEWTFKEVYSTLRERLFELSSAEFEAGVTLVGPQKHDIKFLVNKEDSRFYCSQAQQRLLILSFKTAQVIRYKELHGDHPILLLDDIFSELDKERKGRLISFLKNFKGQLFLTGTDVEKAKDILKEQKGKAFEIREGKVSECQII